MKEEPGDQFPKISLSGGDRKIAVTNWFHQITQMYGGPGQTPPHGMVLGRNSNWLKTGPKPVVISRPVPSLSPVLPILVSCSPRGVESSFGFSRGLVSSVGFSRGVSRGLRVFAYDVSIQNAANEQLDESTKFSLF